MRIATPYYFLSFSSSQRVQMATEPILQVGSLRAQNLLSAATSPPRETVRLCSHTLRASRSRALRSISAAAPPWEMLGAGRSADRPADPLSRGGSRLEQRSGAEQVPL